MGLALLGALLIGLSLGLLGSGGSILTVPTLVFILQRPEKLAITESLSIVAIVALTGAIFYGIRMQIHWKSVLYFGGPGVIGAYLGGWASYYIEGTVQLILFAIMMIGAAGVMLFFPSSPEKYPLLRYSIPLTILEGFFFGILTGLIGIGGGFLIVPALVVFSHLSMPFAIGTSLMIISMNASISFIQQFIVLKLLGMSVSWKVIGIFSVAGILGSLAGSFINEKISQQTLRKIFAVSILFIGFFIILKYVY